MKVIHEFLFFFFWNMIINQSMGILKYLSFSLKKKTHLKVQLILFDKYSILLLQFLLFLFLNVYTDIILHEMAREIEKEKWQ